MVCLAAKPFLKRGWGDLAMMQSYNALFGSQSKRGHLQSHSRLATSRLRESERKRGTKSRDASESRQKSRLVPPAEY